jgi:NADPH:quinone reductase-like Zn-dependent oxidoreductase
MKAIVQDRYGSPEVLRLEDVDKPVIEGDALLVRVHVASVNPADWHLMRGEPYIARASFGLREPKDRVGGCDFAGRIEAVAGNVNTYQQGRRH